MEARKGGDNMIRRTIVSGAIAMVVAVASIASAETLNPDDNSGSINWRSGDSPNEQALVLSSDMTGLALIAGCDVLDGMAYLALGVHGSVSEQDKRRLLGFAGEPTQGLVLTVSGATRDGPFSFATEGSGFYGHSGAGPYTGDLVSHEQLRLLMRATSITVRARGIDHQFSAHGSARTIGQLECAS